MSQYTHLLHIGNNQAETTLLRKIFSQRQSGEESVQVTSVTSYHEFAKQLTRDSYALALSSLAIPVPGCARLLDILHTQTPAIPLILLIDPASEQFVIDAIQQGAVDYVLNTPYMPQQLVHRVQTLLRMQTLQRQLQRSEQAAREYAEQLDIVRELDQAVEQSLRQYAERLESLREIDQAILEAHSTQEIAEVALRHLKTLIPCQRISVLVFNRESHEAIILALRSRAATKLGPGVRFPLKEFLGFQELEQEHVRVYTHSLQASVSMSSFEQGLYAERIRACASIPLIAQGEMLGILHLGAEHRQPFAPEYLDIAREAANQIAVAFQHAHLHQQVERYTTELEQRVNARTEELKIANIELEREARINAAVADLSKTLITTSSLEEISEKILEHAKYFTKSPHGYVGYIEPQTGYLISPTLTKDIWQECQLPEKHVVFTTFGGLWGWVLKHHRPLLTNAPLEDHRSRGVPDGHLPIHRFLSVPAMIDGMVMGQISLANSPREYTDADLHLVERLASLYALALERQQAEEQLRQAKIDAEAANRLKSEFLANMSHEIRTPMNAILGFAELLIEEEPRPDQREKLLIIKQSGGHLLNILNDILDSSEIEAGKFAINSHQFNLKNLLEYLRRQFSEKAAQQQLTFHIWYENSLPSVFVGDEQRLGQILSNLLNNACKFTPEGGAISMTCSYDNGSLCIDVTDTGIGISEEKQQTIFSPFEQVDASISRKHGGAGLGLALTRKLLSLMGGALMVQSQAGSGSTFHVEIPLPAPPEANTESILPAVGEAFPAIYFSKARQCRAGSVSLMGSLTRPVNILVAEDDEMNWVLIQELLKSAALPCDIAENGEIALEKLRTNAYDLLLLDMQMPIMDGLDVLRRVRADASFDNLYIIALTGYASREDAERYVRLGCNDYLAKPIERRRFYQKITRGFTEQGLLQHPSEASDSAVDEKNPQIVSNTAEFNPKQYQTIGEIAERLREQCAIFHPEQIYPLADQLEQTSSKTVFQQMKAQLYEAADTFDDQALQPIVKALEEMLQRYEK